MPLTFAVTDNGSTGKDIAIPVEMEAPIAEYIATQLTNGLPTYPTFEALLIATVKDRLKSIADIHPPQLVKDAAVTAKQAQADLDAAKAAAIAVVPGK